MASLKLLLLLFNATVILVVFSDHHDCPTISAYDNLPVDVVTPNLYNIDFTVTNKIIHGVSNILLKVYHETRHISIHAYDMNIGVDSIVLNTVNTNYRRNVKYITKQVIQCDTSQTLQVTFDKNLSLGIYNLYIKFQVPAWSALIPYNKYLWLSTERTELNSARRMFPCWDNPGTKAHFNISVRHSKYQNALSNVQTSHMVYENDGTRTTYFTETTVLAPREVAIAVIEYVIQLGSIKLPGVTRWLRPQVDDYSNYLLVAIEKCKKTYETYMGKYIEITSKSDHILAPNTTMKIIGYPGLNIYREQDFTYNEKVDYPGRKNRILNLLGLETARRWFDGIISPFSWSVSWFSEMFALFINHILTEKLQNKMMQDLYAIQMVQSAFIQDEFYHMDPILYQSNYNRIEKDLYFRIHYNKGVALLRMLYYLFTADDFRNAILMYTNDNKHTLFKPNDLWGVMERILEEKNKKLKYTVQRLMDSWLKMRSYPIVYVSRDYDNNTIFFSKVNDFAGNIIPVTYVKQSDLTSDYTRNVTWNVIWLDDFGDKSISGIPADDIIIVNVEQVGYYRVNYDPQSWRKILTYLIFNDHTYIPAINRAQLIDDAFYFTIRGELNYTIFSQLVWHLSRETNLVAWYSVFNILSYTSTYLELPEGDKFKRDIQFTLKIFLEIIGYEERSDDDDMKKPLRLLAVRWACRLDIQDCKSTALSKLTAYLNQIGKPLPWWREWLFCTGMEMADLFLWQKWLKKCNSEQKAPCFTYLSCARDEKIINYYLNMLLEKTEMHGMMSEIGSLTLYHTLFKKQAKHLYILALFLYNQDKIIDKIYNGHNINPLQLIGETMRTIYSKEGLEMMTTYAERLGIRSWSDKRQFKQMISFRLNELKKTAQKFKMLSKSKV